MQCSIRTFIIDILLWLWSGRYVELSTLTPSGVEYLEIWVFHSPGTLSACPGL